MARNKTRIFDEQDNKTSKKNRQKNKQKKQSSALNIDKSGGINWGDPQPGGESGESQQPGFLNQIGNDIRDWAKGVSDRTKNYHPALQLTGLPVANEMLRPAMDTVADFGKSTIDQQKENIQGIGNALTSEAGSISPKNKDQKDKVTVEPKKEKGSPHKGGETTTYIPTEQGWREKSNQSQSNNKKKNKGVTGSAKETANYDIAADGDSFFVKGAKAPLSPDKGEQKVSKEDFASEEDWQDYKAAKAMQGEEDALDPLGKIRKELQELRRKKSGFRWGGEDKDEIESRISSLEDQMEVEAGYQAETADAEAQKAYYNRGDKGIGELQQSKFDHLLDMRRLGLEQQFEQVQDRKDRQQETRQDYRQMRNDLYNQFLNNAILDERAKPQGFEDDWSKLTRSEKATIKTNEQMERLFPQLTGKKKSKKGKSAKDFDK